MRGSSLVLPEHFLQFVSDLLDIILLLQCQNLIALTNLRKTTEWTDFEEGSIVGKHRKVSALTPIILLKSPCCQCMFLRCETQLRVLRGERSLIYFNNLPPSL